MGLKGSKNLLSMAPKRAGGCILPDMTMKSVLPTLAFSLLLLAPTSGFAGLINNSLLNVSGDALAGAASITWQCDLPGDVACPAAGHGDFATTSSTGSFAQYNGTFGLIANINQAAQPLNTPFSLPRFMTFDLNNDIMIELNFIPLGTDTVSSTCAGLQHCTPQNNAFITPTNPGGLSAFNLDQQGVNTAATFSIVGKVHQLSSGQTGDLNGLFTSQFANMTPQQVLAALGQSNSTYSSNLSLVLTTTVPEPGTTALMLGGLLVLAGASRRFPKSR
jgi:hypothetical protein